jgi:hypothetical protein
LTLFCNNYEIIEESDFFGLFGEIGEFTLEVVVFEEKLDFGGFSVYSSDFEFLAKFEFSELF